MVLTAYVVLSPATNSSCHRRWRINSRSAPGWADVPFANLAPATGARTTRFCRPRPVFAKRLRRAWYPSAEALAKAAATSFVSAPFDRSRASRPTLPSRHAPDAAASTASRPASVTIAIRPSVGWDGDGYEVIWVRRKRKYFCKRGWTGKSPDSPSGKSRLRLWPCKGRARVNFARRELIRHSITSSASARSVDGIFTSIARAVCRLIASVNRVGS
jgi:hypothetical protein